MADLKRSVEYAILYLQEKAGAAKRPSGAFLRKQELRLEKKVSARFNRQMRWILAEVEKMVYFQESKGVHRYVTKTIREDVDAILENLPENEPLVEAIVETANDTYKRGARDVHAQLKMEGYGVSFNLVNPYAVEYLQKLKDLQLSNFKGAIQRETKSRIQKLLVDAIEEGTSYSEVARKIRAQGEAGVFSRARSELIAVNQVGQAYGAGNDQMVRQFNFASSVFTQKYWQTVEDSRVTEECMDNEKAGWLGMDESFKSGDKFAPRKTNPRCRCVTRYRVVDLQGNPI